MLRSIKINNFGPIEKEIIFSMEKGKTTQFEENIIKNTNLLKTMYIYGANNSGKSKLVETLRFLKDIFEFGKEIFNQKNYFPFIFNNENDSTKLEYNFFIKNKEYIYTLEINFISKKIIKEILKIDEEIIFKRNEETAFVNEREIKVDPNIFFLMYYYSQIGDKEEVNFLVEYINGIIYIEQQRGSDSIIKAQSFTNLEKINFLENNLEKINLIIKDFGFNFDMVVIKGIDQVGRETKTIGVNKIFNDKHFQAPIYFLESFGTNVFVDLLLEIEKNDKSELIVIDEIERGVHFALVASFINYINTMYPKKQLILPTHMTDLLDSELHVRKDQIYIVENSSEKGYVLERRFSKKAIRETMNFQKILKSKSVGGVPNIKINSDVL
ncbi:AAA family ATPase [Fusobacterium sp.]|uniref:AAA family ATPase n=1 Tax=Fusobacterium sp. TaxID=68766 RepID=UPI002605A56B|nr:AAA family ATPase [Fusobacterium sp.]